MSIMRSSSKFGWVRDMGLRSRLRCSVNQELNYLCVCIFVYANPLALRLQKSFPGSFCEQALLLTCTLVSAELQC